MPFGTISADRITGTNGNSISPESSVFRNRIINGAMTIDQRNAGSSVTPTSTGILNYCLDRWAAVVSQSSKYSVQQNAGSVTPPAGFTNYLGVTSLAATSLGAGDYFYLAQKIEGYNTADLAFGTANAKTITISFWVRSSLTGTFGCSISNASENRFYPFTYTISAANTWEQKSVTITGDTSGTWASTTSTGIQVIFGLGIGSTYSATPGAWGSGSYGATGATSVVGTNGATFYITGVQLEVGSTATSFDYLDYGRSLIQCQRYFQVYGNSSAEGVAIPTQSTASAGEWDGYMTLPTVMRSTPTATISNLQISDGNTARINATTIAVYQTSTYNGCGIFGCYMTVSGATQYRPYLLCTSSAGGYLRLSSEL